MSSLFLDCESAWTVLDLAPIGIALIQERRILWINRAFAASLHCEPESLRGMNLDALPAGLVALVDGDGGEPSLTLPDGSNLRLRRWSSAVPGKDVVAYFFEDITGLRTLEAERDHLKVLVATLETRDPETGMKNRNAILQAVENQISRSRRYSNPLSVIRITLSSPPNVTDPQRTLREISQEFNSQLRWADEIGRLDQENILLVLPETPLRDALDLAAKLQHDRIALASRAQGWTMAFAATDWRPGDDARKLLARLDSSAV